ncbi:MAG: polyphenol oxidase family protein [Verrucomicrobiota bacterium]|nr:polyphenol oxidase family protein [Verrucomicrobiota bacterium]
MKINQIKFNSLTAISDIKHTFILRSSKLNVALSSKDEGLKILRPYHEQGVKILGSSPEHVTTAEQIHGDTVVVVSESKGMDCPVPGADGLMTCRKEILLGIYVADCCAVYIVDKYSRAVALIHSGMKGSQLGIVKKALSLMQAKGIEPEDLIVQLSPCIRPPAYEVDFAAFIRKDCLEFGVRADSIYDDGDCTSMNLKDYYSYRSERGKTGRMLALVGIK